MPGQVAGSQAERLAQVAELGALRLRGNREDAEPVPPASQDSLLLAQQERLLRLDPADQVVPADRVQQGWMVGGYMPPDHPDHLVIAIAAGHEPAFASDQLHARASYPGYLPQRNARMLA